MNVSLDCEITKESLSESEKKSENDSKIHMLILRKFEELEKGMLFYNRKNKKKHPDYSKIAANQKGNIFSIITGIALVGIGSVIGLACPPAGAVVAGTGIGLITNAIVNEINEACEPKKPPNQPNNLPSSAHPNDVQNGGNISINMPI